MSATTRPLPACLLALPLLACGASEDPAAPGPASSPDAARTDEVAAAESLGTEPLPADAAPDLGALHGVIRITGDVPERFPIGARKVADCTTHPDVEHLSDLVLARDGLLQNAFVTLESGYDADAIPPPSSEPVTIDQRGCIYTPHVSAAQKGLQVLVANSDPTTHNVNIHAPRNNRSQNLSMVKGQAPIECEYKRAERVSLRCDIHPWMSAWLHVSDHPWFDVSDANGAFRIPDVPPGEYVVSATHEEFGDVRGRVTVEAGRSTGFALTFQAD